MKIISSLFAVLSASALVAVSANDDSCLSVPTVEDLDLTQYASKPWYVQQQAETSYLPREQNRCVTAQYELRKRRSFPWRYTVNVYNYAENEEGRSFSGGLCAVYDKSVNSQLKVAPCFLPQFFAGPYWVVAYDEDEGYALVSGGQPGDVVEGDAACGSDGNSTCCKTGDGINNSGLWIFTREQEPPSELVEKVRGIANELGFSTSVLFDVDHSNCDVPGIDDRVRYLRKGN